MTKEELKRAIEDQTILVWRVNRTSLLIRPVELLSVRKGRTPHFSAQPVGGGATLIFHVGEVYCPTPDELLTAHTVWDKYMEWEHMEPFPGW